VHALAGHSQGLYAYAVDGLTLDANVFDHNGWNEAISGAGADIFSHNLYIDNDNTNVVVSGNVIANASSHGMQLRCGGVVQGNLFTRNSIALSVGGGNNPELGGVVADVRGNVIIDGKNIDDANKRGWGMWFANISSGRIYRNIIANNTDGTQPAAVIFDGAHKGDDHPSIGVRSLAFVGNVIHNWGNGILIEGNNYQIDNLELSGNDIQEAIGKLVEHRDPSSVSSVGAASNRFHSLSYLWMLVGTTETSLAAWMALVHDTTSKAQKMGYLDPTRLVPPGFLSQARLQSRARWLRQYTGTAAVRYLAAGFAPGTA
jgi:hypothetical protein